MSDDDARQQDMFSGEDFDAPAGGEEEQQQRIKEDAAFDDALQKAIKDKPPDGPPEPAPVRPDPVAPPPEQEPGGFTFDHASAAAEYKAYALQSAQAYAHGRAMMIDQQLASLGPPIRPSEEQLLGMSETDKWNLQQANLVRQKLMYEREQVGQQAAAMARQNEALANHIARTQQDAYVELGAKLGTRVMDEVRRMRLDAAALANPGTYRFLADRIVGAEHRERAKRGKMRRGASVAGGGGRQASESPNTMTSAEVAYIRKHFGDEVAGLAASVSEDS